MNIDGFKAPKPSRLSVPIPMSQCPPEPGAWEAVAPAVPPHMPTGAGFIDRYLGGGMVPGEVYGLLGPYGSGKSTLGRMIVSNSAKAFSASGQKRRAVYVGFEESVKVNTALMIAYLAEIDRGKFYQMPMPLTHEERRRGGSAAALLASHSCLIDTRGEAGQGYVDGIAAAIEATVTTDDVGLVVIDYAGAAARRHAAHPSEWRDLIGNMPYFVKRKIAERFACPVWLLHQLSGAINDAHGPRDLASHTDAAEAKNFGENLDFAFVIGKKNKRDLARFACTKPRREPTRDGTVVELLGRWCKVIEADAEERERFWQER